MNKSRNLYTLPLVAFTAGITAGTLACVYCSRNLYSAIVRYLPILHMEAEKRSYGWTYGKYLCLLRFPAFCVMSAAMFTSLYAFFYGGLAFFSGIQVSVLIVAVTMFQGMLGFPKAMALLLPQGLFYLFGFWAMYELTIKRKSFSGWEQFQIVIKIAAIWMAGIVLEAILSPSVLCAVLN